MKSKILGLLAVGLLAGPMAANAFEITIERISDTQALITGSGNLGFLAPPISAANAIFLFNPFATEPAPGTKQSVFDGSTLFVGVRPIIAAEVWDASSPFLFFASAGNFAPGSAFAGALRVNLGVSSTFLDVGSTGVALWGLDAPNTNFLGGWRIVAPRAAPEPGTLALFGLGLAGLGLTRRRKH